MAVFPFSQVSKRMNTIEMKPVGTATMQRRPGVAIPSAYKICCAAAASLLLGLSSAVTAAPNILLIIGDDMGVETLASYGVGENPPTTAALDELARDGVRFTNVWSQPSCSPTRATMITGRYGFRTSVGLAVGGNLPPMAAPPDKPAWASSEPPPRTVANGRGMGVEPGSRPALLPEEFTLPMALKQSADLGYATAAIGKWHLADGSNGWLDHPNQVGFDHYAGMIDGTPGSYFTWNKVVNREVSGTTGYMPADKADDAIRWIGDQGDNPWFLWFAFSLPHVPFHLPPEETWQSDYSHIDPESVPPQVTDGPDETYPYFSAMIEAMDTQIGRLLASLEPEVRDNTYVVFLGDNGSGVVSPPFRSRHIKGTVYQGGINVPMIVTGPGVARGGVSEALVNSTDLFATIMEMAGIDPEEAVPDEVTHDSISFFSALSDSDAPTGREWLYADYFIGGFAGVADGDYAMRDDRYKLLRHHGAVEFYDLERDPYEHDNLLTGDLSAEEDAAYRSLGQRIQELRSSD